VYNFVSFSVFGVLLFWTCSIKAEKFTDERSKNLASSKSGLPSRGNKNKVSLSQEDSVKVVSGLEVRYCF